jgi:phage N-6-adenine-methyltransferase
MEEQIRSHDEATLQAAFEAVYGKAPIYKQKKLKAKDSWSTPQPEFDIINAEFRLNWDVCASDDNHKLPNYFTIQQDGLKQSWKGLRCWCNPRYSDPAPWIRKALWGSQRNCAFVVMLIKADPSTAVWRECIAPYAEVRPFDRRVKFVKPEGITLSAKNKGQSPDFPSVLVIFRDPALRDFLANRSGCSFHKFNPPLKIMPAIYGHKPKKRK